MLREGVLKFRVGFVVGDTMEGVFLSKRVWIGEEERDIFWNKSVHEREIKTVRR